MKRLLAQALAAALLLGAVPVTGARAENGAVPASGYRERIDALYQRLPCPDEAVVIRAAAVESAEGVEIRDAYEGSAGPVLMMGDTGTAVYAFDVGQTGLYTLMVRYYPAAGRNGRIEREIRLDGEPPADDVSYFSLSRVWNTGEGVRHDADGNDLRPEMREASRWLEAAVRDPSGYITGPLVFYLERGRHTLSLTSVKEEAAFDSFTFQPYRKPPAYEEALAAWREAGYTEADGEALFERQGEDVWEVSDSSIVPVNDRSSAGTYPQDPARLKLNTIGADKWQGQGQWITWRVRAERKGLYRIALRYKQDLLSGMYVCRSLEINGTQPFREADSLTFAYGRKWEVAALGDGDTPYLFPLEEGDNEITMWVSFGDVGDYLRQAQECLKAVNTIYKDILMVTGATPDTQRDYAFDKILPGTIAAMGEQAAKLEAIAAVFEEKGGAAGSYTVILHKLAGQLARMRQKPAGIAANFDTFKSNIGALGDWLLSASYQPLQIDRLYLAAPDGGLPGAEAGFFSTLGYHVMSFVASFFNDYDAVGSLHETDGSGEEIKVWLATGRDQVQTLRMMIDDGFTPETGVRVSLQLVAAGALMPSVLAGIAPDVAMFNAAGDPVNYAVRGAVVNLSKFDDLQEVTARFHPSAMVPFTYRDYVCALPETQSFSMFFYRTDIFNELGLTVPETWEDFKTVISTLQQNGMTAGMPSSLAGYSLMLFQRGGRIYKNAGAEIDLDSRVAMHTLEDFLDFFTTYELPLVYDFANRFRIGEMPCGIQDYTMYNQLMAFAPEIRGLWTFAPVPGTRREDGGVDHTSLAGGTGVMMMSGTKHEQAAWKYMKWWVGAEAQSRYANEMEGLLGPSGKQASANREAVASMSWVTADYERIAAQWETVQAIPEVPGSYILGRYFDFVQNKIYSGVSKKTSSILGFRSAPVEMLLGYRKEINRELSRKQAEFEETN